MKLAPTNAAAAPTAVATAFIATTCPRGTTCGSDADRPEPTKRETPLTSSAGARIDWSFAPRANSTPTAASSTSRAAFAPTKT